MMFALADPDQRWQIYCASLPISAHDAVLYICQQADYHKLKIYAVGGYIRDLVLTTALSDIDLVVEGDALVVAQDLAHYVNGILHIHPAFGTATVLWDEIALDLITARREQYPHPAALPVVNPADLAADLTRRDFSINTLALALNGDQRGELIDQHHALDDLAKRQIRVLHADSFIDDPTRIWRAIRFAARLNFRLEDRTIQLLRQAVQVGMLAQTTPVRIWHEIALLLAESCAADGLQLAADLGVLQTIHSDLVWNEHVYAQVYSIVMSNYTLHEQQTLIWLLLLWPLAHEQRMTLSEHFNVPKQMRHHVQHITPIQAVLSQLTPSDLSDGTLDALLNGLDHVGLIVAEMMSNDTVKARITHYDQVLRQIPNRTTGDDLRRQGIPPGPIYKQLLAEARRQQLDELQRSNNV